MQQLAEQDAQADCIEIRPPRNRKTSARRKVTVRLSETVCGRLDTATDRPGVGKSMLVEAALEHFLNPAPSVEALVKARFDEMHARFDRFEHDMRMMAETVALQARYQLAVTPPVPQERQREAILFGDERFKVLAEQVDRRVRQRRPLMQETIDCLNSNEGGRTQEATRAQGPRDSGQQQNGGKAASAHADIAGPSRFGVANGRTKSDAVYRPIRSTDLHDVSKNAEQDRQARAPESGPGLRGEQEISSEPPLSNWRLMLSVFLPFAAGYFLSFLFRTINASISPALASDLGLGAVETGLLASIYFLVFAGAQIPIGVLLDRYGPRRVQSVLLVIAVGGTTLFGNADSFAELLIGRAMIGLGVAASLMAGLKAIVAWFPKDRIAFVNGGMIMLGSLGAVTATTPTDWLMNWIGWRSLFEVLTVATLVTAGLIYFVVPERSQNSASSATSGKPLTLRSIFSDPRFLRIAPLSATCIGSSWAMQSLWAASWLSDVEGFDRQAVVNQLFAMALGISLGALLLGTMADRLRKRGITAEVLLAIFGGLFMLAELALVLRVPLPSILPWSIVSVVGAATVLSYAIIADYFPVEISARANGALNLLHFGWAFAAQYGIGLVVGHWVPQEGHYPTIAYQASFDINLMLQAAALIWFAVPWIRSLTGRLSRVFARPKAGSDDRSLPVAPLAERSILQPSPGMDW
jgi:predicted MFS family arabinose efflux permease